MIQEMSGIKLTQPIIKISISYPASHKICLIYQEKQKVKLPRMMLGANPFHGVSYKSSAQRKEYRSYFNSAHRIYEIIEKSVEIGVKGIHVYTNDLEIEAVTMARKKYNEMLTVVAVLPDIYGALSRQAGTPDGKISTNLAKLKVLLKNSTSFISAGIKGDLVPLIRRALETELRLMEDTHPDVVLLHGALADIACATKQRDVLNVFIEKVREKGAVPGFATHNFLRLVESLKEMNISIPIIMAPFNKTGFMMNPSQEACINVFKEIKNETTVIAKKVLAGGILDPYEAQQYIFNELNIESAAIGIGNLYEVEKTFSDTKNILGDLFGNDIEIS